MLNGAKKLENQRIKKKLQSMKKHPINAVKKGSKQKTKQNHLQIQQNKTVKHAEC